MGADAALEAMAAAVQRFDPEESENRRSGRALRPALRRSSRGWPVRRGFGTPGSRRRLPAEPWPDDRWAERPGPHGARNLRAILSRAVHGKEEADLVARMPTGLVFPAGASPRVVKKARRKQLAGLLGGLAAKGLVFRLRDWRGSGEYAISPFVIGVFRVHDDALGRRRRLPPHGGGCFKDYWPRAEVSSKPTPEKGRRCR